MFVGDWCPHCTALTFLTRVRRQSQRLQDGQDYYTCILNKLAAIDTPTARVLPYYHLLLGRMLRQGVPATVAIYERLFDKLLAMAPLTNDIDDVLLEQFLGFVHSCLYSMHLFRSGYTCVFCVWTGSCCAILSSVYVIKCRVVPTLCMQWSASLLL